MSYHDVALESDERYQQGVRDGLEKAALIAEHVAANDRAPLVRSFDEAFRASGHWVAERCRAAVHTTEQFGG